MSTAAKKKPAAKTVAAPAVEKFKKDLEKHVTDLQDQAHKAIEKVHKESDKYLDKYLDAFKQLVEKVESNYKDLRGRFEQQAAKASEVDKDAVKLVKERAKYAQDEAKTLIAAAKKDYEQVIKAIQGLQVNSELKAFVQDKLDAATKVAKSVSKPASKAKAAAKSTVKKPAAKAAPKAAEKTVAAKPKSLAKPAKKAAPKAAPAAAPAEPAAERSVLTPPADA